MGLMKARSFCVRCKKEAAIDQMKWVGNLPFCEDCFGVKDIDHHKRVSYILAEAKRENPGILMPDMLEADAVNEACDDTVIKAYVPLCDIVCELKTVSETVEPNEHDTYESDIISDVICINPATRKYYLMRKTQNRPKNADPEDYPVERTVLREIPEEEISEEIKACAADAVCAQPDYLAEFPCYSSRPDDEPPYSYAEDKNPEYLLPDKMYCCDTDFNDGRGDEYLYLRRVNGSYRLFYLKRWNQGRMGYKKECSEAFIASMFKRIDFLNENPVFESLFNGDGDVSSLFLNMPMIACDRKLTENECRAISRFLFDAVFDIESTPFANHRIEGFYVFLSGEDYRLLKLPAMANETQVFFKALANIAKYGF